MVIATALMILCLILLAGCSTPVTVKPDKELTAGCAQVPVPTPLTLRNLLGYGVQQQEVIAECNCRMAALRGEKCK